jgi:hypothetical protein
MDVRNLLSVAILLCGVGCDGGGGGGGGGQTSVDFDASYTCCLNGAFYECDDSDAVFDCGEGDTSGCDRDSSADDQC